MLYLIRAHSDWCMVNKQEVLKILLPFAFKFSNACYHWTTLRFIRYLLRLVGGGGRECLQPFLQYIRRTAINNDC